MTKVFALLSVAAVFAFASCGEKKAEVVTEDTAVVVPVADTTTTVAAPDTTAKVDTTAKH